MVHDEIAEDRGYNLRKTNQDAVKIDTKRVILESQLGSVELEWGKEMKDDAHDGNDPQRIKPEEIQNRYDIIVLLFFVLLVLCLDIRYLL